MNLPAIGKEPCIERVSCRICGSTRFTSVIDLGEQFIASAFVNDRIPASLNRRYPTEVVRCTEGCGLVQLRHSIDPGLLYAEGYGYRSGTNELMRRNLRDIARATEAMAGLKAGDTVLDIGCNDGTLLDSYSVNGLHKVGFDPVPNIAAVAKEKGIFVINEFFSAAAFRREPQLAKPRAITSIAMFYDLEAPVAFAKDVAALLSQQGVWVIELSYLPLMLKSMSFDTICHEHLEYYGLRQIEWIAQNAGLTVGRVEFNDANGGSFRVFLRPAGTQISPADMQTVADARRLEAALALDSDVPYHKFRDAVAKVREQLKRLLQELKRSGKKVYVYGASTKGNTLLQYCGLDSTLIGKAADRNPDKWGRRTLGTNIPIVSEEEARIDEPDFFLVLPWHLFPTFVKREADFLARGGKFILPLPAVQVLGSGELTV